MLRGVPRRITDRIEELLRQDGFKQSARGIYVKTWDRDWVAWFGIDGTPYALGPRVGVFNKELLQIRRRALKRISSPPAHQPGGGPPLIMVSLEKLLGDDPGCSKQISWQYKGDERETGPELRTTVADDLVRCLRTKAYPFFDAHITFESIIDAATAGMASHALPFYLPIILLKLGRRGDVPKYVKDWTRHYSNESSARSYQRYVAALVDIFALESKH